MSVKLTDADAVMFVDGALTLTTGATVSITALSGVSVTLGTATIPASFAGLVSPGTYQINFTIPLSAPLGSQPVIVDIAGAISAAANIVVTD